MQWRKIFVGILVGLSLLAAGQVSAQDYKLAFVEVGRLMRDAPQVEAVLGKLKKEFARRDDELVAQQKQIKKLEEKLQRDGAIMSESEAKRLERDIISRARKLKGSQTEFQEDLSLRQNEELGKLRKVISEVIFSVAKADNIDIVLEAGVVYVSDRANIADKVLARLTEQHKTGK